MITILVIKSIWIIFELKQDEILNKEVGEGIECFVNKIRRMKMTRRETVLSYALSALVIISAVLEFTVFA
jgi:hypothetical protein